MSTGQARVRHPYILCTKDDCERPALTVGIFYSSYTAVWAGCYKHPLAGADIEFTMTLLRQAPWGVLHVVKYEPNALGALIQWLGADGCKALDDRKAEVRDGR